MFNLLKIQVICFRLVENLKSVSVTLGVGLRMNLQRRKFAEMTTNFKQFLRTFEISKHGFS